MQKKYDTPFKPKADFGSLNATLNKNNADSPDYWGEVRVNMKDLTGIATVDGMTIVRISGWKKIDKNGKTYLSLAVNRWVPEVSPEPQPQRHADDFGDQDIPF
jgi:hypothetical protein